MRYNILSGTTETVPAIGLGTWVLGGENWGGANEEESVAVIREAVKQGMRLIDTAPFYGDGLAERLVGQAVRTMRDRVFIATKCGVIRENGRFLKTLAPASVIREADVSRTRLGMDVIDLYQCHWPDEKTPLEKTMEAMFKLQSLGRVRHIGVCNFGVDLLRAACSVAPVRTLQVPYSLLDRSIEEELLPFCIEKGIGVIVYGAMGGGILSGKYTSTPSFDKRDARRLFYKFYTGDKVATVNKSLGALRVMGRPLSQTALNWVRQQPGIMTVLAGCRTQEQVRVNASAADWELSVEEVGRIKGLGW